MKFTAFLAPADGIRRRGALPGTCLLRDAAFPVGSLQPRLVRVVMQDPRELFYSSISENHRGRPTLMPFLIQLTPRAGKVPALSSTSNGPMASAKSFLKIDPRSVHCFFSPYGTGYSCDNE